MLDFVYFNCIDDFKILKSFNKLSKFSTIFHRETSQAPISLPPPNVHMTFLVDKIDMWRFPYLYLSIPLCQKSRRMHHVTFQADRGRLYKT